MRSRRSAWCDLCATLTLVGCLDAHAQSAPAAPRCDQTDDATVARLRNDIEYLASDALGGREPGTPGGVAAATYLVQRLTALGVAPAGDEGYAQRFRVEYGVEAAPPSQVLLRAHGETRVLTFDRDVRVVNAPPHSGSGRAVGALVYAGHGLDAPEARWSDFEQGTHVRGRVVVVLSGPPRASDAAMAEGLRRAGVVGSLAGKVRAARRRGAVALIEISLDPNDPVETYIPPPGGGIPAVRISLAQGAWLLGRTPTVETTPTRPWRIMGASARVVTSTRRHEVETQNVLAIVPGRHTPRGSTHAPLILGAHYDHIGHGGWSSLSPGVYAIYNGADDNASGTAALLELARRIALRPLERDVVFVWFGAEELGMVGSRWLVAHRTPAVSAPSAAAMLNMDMIGRLRDCRLFVESRETAHGFAALIDDVSRGTGLDTRPWEPSRGPWGASDHMTFIDARVPSLFLFTGLHGDYHRPTDDLPTLNLQGLGSVVGFAESLLRNLDAAIARAPGDFTFRAPGAAR